jgi:hypothetical protein
MLEDYSQLRGWSKDELLSKVAGGDLAATIIWGCDSLMSAVAECGISICNKLEEQIAPLVVKLEDLQLPEIQDKLDEVEATIKDFEDKLVTTVTKAAKDIVGAVEDLEH